MERQGLGRKRWGLGIRGSRFGVGGSGFGKLLGLAILVMGTASASGSGGVGELGVTVRVYDYAHVPRGTLIAAEEKMAAGIFRQAGVAMQWCNVTTDSAESQMDSSCDQLAGRAGLELRIVPRLKVVPGVYTDSTEGFAVGNLATVSYDWVEEADPRHFTMPWVLLGCAIAHEIGHLLLGPNSHSPTGIMQGHWSANELQFGGWGRRRFTPHQAEIIRAEVLARSGERRAALTAPDVPPTR